MSKPPLIVGLQLCEQIIVDAETRNVTLVNCFNKRHVRQVPSDPLTFMVYGLLTDGSGPIPLTLQIERLDTLETILEWRAVGRFDSPLRDVRCRIRVRDFSFPVEGFYQVALLADGDLIALKKLEIAIEGGTNE